MAFAHERFVMTRRCKLLMQASMRQTGQVYRSIPHSGEHLEVGSAKRPTQSTQSACLFEHMRALSGIRRCGVTPSSRIEVTCSSASIDVVHIELSYQAATNTRARVRRHHMAGH